VTLNDVAIDSSDLKHYTTEGSLGQWEACNRDKRRFNHATFWLSADVRFLVCGHVAQLPTAWVASLLRPRLRYVLVAQGIAEFRPLTFWQRRAVKSAWRIFCSSEFTRGELLKHLRLDPKRVVVMPNALDLELTPDGVDSDSITASQPVILSVARLSSIDRHKGVDHLIAAMPAILQSAPGTKLRIVGHGDDIHRLQNLVREHRVDSAVEFSGHVDDRQLRHELARCSLFALPREKEGFGLVYLEAMAHGKPCIAASSANAPRAITKESGLLVPYGDVAALSSACIAALQTSWDATVIRACASRFSYPVFREHLRRLMNDEPAAVE
jgi:glycosyltransferase involved in cell wall biosynthesis